MNGARGATRVGVAVLLASTLVACGDTPGRERSSTSAETSASVRTSGLQAGGAAPREARNNPYEGNPRALAEGRQYYIWMNCHACHGEMGGGGIGPPFADPVWIYGSAPENIYQSIVQGRPNGMPAYGGVIPEDRVWLIAAYVRSLGPPDPRELQPESPTRLPESPAYDGSGDGSDEGPPDPEDPA